MLNTVLCGERIQRSKSAVSNNHHCITFCYHRLRSYDLIAVYKFVLLFFFLPWYSVPEDLEITNKEKKNYNGCNGLAGSERVLK